MEKRLLGDREILVSVTNEGPRALFKGAGLVKATPGDTLELATDPKKLQELISEIKELSWDPKEGPFKVRVKILWFDRIIEGKAKVREFSEKAVKGIDFSVEKGLWFGLRGALEMREYSENQCLTVIFGETLEGENLSWPTRVGLEVTLQRMAGTLRRAVEGEKEKKKL